MGALGWRWQRLVRLGRQGSAFTTATLSFERAGQTVPIFQEWSASAVRDLCTKLAESLRLLDLVTRIGGSRIGILMPATDADGWFDTGDLARIDRRGNLSITGRSKDLIKSGGEWINPNEIESLVAALPAVSQAAVIGRPHPKWGERPILLVELGEDGAVSDDALLEPLRGRVASWCMPDEIVRVPAMPLGPTGKIDKLTLRSEYGRG